MFRLVIKRGLGAVPRPSAASMVARLRAETGHSLALCRRALEDAQLDLGAARVVLARLAEGQAEKTQAAGQAREQRHGLVGLAALSPASVGLVEMRCLTDFVARNPLFVELAGTMLRSLATVDAAETTDAPAIQSQVEAMGLSGPLLEAVGRLKEPITVTRLCRIRCDPAESMGTYVHQPVAPGLGSVAAVVSVKGGSQKVATDLAKHVAGMKPASVVDLLQQEFLFNPAVSVRGYLDEACPGASVTFMHRVAL